MHVVHLTRILFPPMQLMLLFVDFFYDLLSETMLEGKTIKSTMDRDNFDFSKGEKKVHFFSTIYQIVTKVIHFCI